MSKAMELQARVTELETALKRADNTDQLLTRAWRRVNTATTGAERFRWLLIVAILEGYQCKPGSSTSAKAS